MQMVSMLLHITQHYSLVSAGFLSSFGFNSTSQVLSTSPSSEVILGDTVLTSETPDIRIVVFTSTESKDCGEDENSATRFRVFVNSAPARQKIQPLDAFAWDNFRHFPQTEQSFLNDSPLVQFGEEIGSFAKLHFDRNLYDETGGQFTSSFFGLTFRDDGETTMVIPDGPCASDNVIIASCETLARFIGWHVERREVGCKIQEELGSW